MRNMITTSCILVYEIRTPKGDENGFEIVETKTNNVYEIRTPKGDENHLSSGFR